jgi:hypothetical protein
MASASDPAEAGSSADHTNEQAHALASELRATAERCGPDSVALQASLLVETLRAGAVAPSEVGVEGPAAPPNQDYLRIRVLTGLIFDPAASTPQTRLAQIWSGVVAPAIGKMDGFNITPGGLELAMGYGLQAFGEFMDRKADPSEKTETVGRTLRISEATLTRLASDEVTADEVLELAFVTEEQPWARVAPAEAQRSSSDR